MSVDYRSYLSIPLYSKIVCKKDGKFSNVSISKDEEFSFHGICGEGVVLWSDAYECTILVPYKDFYGWFIFCEVVAVCIEPIWDIEVGEILRMEGYTGIKECGIIIRRKQEERYLCSSDTLEKHFVLKTLEK